MSKWIRICQECGYKQQSKSPTEYSKGYEAWRELKCKHCKSPALDYGSEQSEDEEKDE